MSEAKFEIPKELHYTKEHCWFKVEGNKVRTGISDYAQKALHEIVFVDIPTLGEKIDCGDPLGTIESVKAVVDVLAPISGEVIEVNRKLSETPELLNKDPYGEGWIAIISPTSLETDVKKALDAKEYSAFIEELAKET